MGMERGWVQGDVRKLLPEKYMGLYCGPSTGEGGHGLIQGIHTAELMEDQVSEHKVWKVFVSALRIYLLDRDTHSPVSHRLTPGQTPTHPYPEADPQCFLVLWSLPCLSDEGQRWLVLVWFSPLPVFSKAFISLSDSSVGKIFTCNAWDSGLIPGSGRSPGEGKGYPFQYSALENSMDCIVHWVLNSWTQLSDFHFTPLCLQVQGALDPNCGESGRLRRQG